MRVDGTLPSMPSDRYPLEGKVLEGFYFAGLWEAIEATRFFARLEDGSCYRISGAELLPCVLPPDAEKMSNEDVDLLYGKTITEIGVGEAGPIFEFASVPTHIEFSIRKNGRPL